MAFTNSSPNSWNSQIEKAKEKSRKLLKKVIAFETSGNLIVGKLEDVSTDRLFRENYPFIKLTLSNARKYNAQGAMQKVFDEEQICFANKPEMVLDIDELQKKYPEIHADTHVEIKRGRFD